MTKRILALAAVAVTLCSCDKVHNGASDVNLNGEETIFTATIESMPTTKATIDGLTPSWEVGDLIRINTHYVYEAQSVGTKSDFYVVSYSQKVKGDSFEAIFPWNYMQWQGSDSYFYFSPDEGYEWQPGKFNMPMYAKSDNTELNFMNICGVLKISVDAHIMTQVKSIMVSNPNKLMNGSFIVSPEGDMVLNDPTDPMQYQYLRRRKIVFTDPVPVSDESKDFYFPLAPQTYDSLKIEISEDDATFPYHLSTKKDVHINIKRNQIYNVVFTNPDSTEYLDINRSSGLGNDDFE